MEADLTGRKILVVGGNSGVGFALCRQLLLLKAEVLIAGRSREKLETAREQLASVGTVALCTADVTREDDVRTMFENCGSLDHIVCTAADVRGSYELLAAVEMEAIDRAIRSKVVAPILLAKHGAPLLKPHGSLTLTSGIAAYRPRPRGVVVAAINAALEGAVRALALELAPRRVNAVSPGWVRTPIWQDVAGADSENMLASMAARLPVGRIGMPDDIANAILFLLGNGYTTGEVLHVEGGQRLV